MARARPLTAEQVAALMKVAEMMNALPESVPTIGDMGLSPDADIEQELKDIEAETAALRTSTTPAKPAKTDLKPLPRAGTQSITIRIPKSVVYEFKAHAGKGGKGYQKCMNRVLREAARKMREDDVVRKDD